MSVGLKQSGRAILLGGLSAGVLDITAACINSGRRGRGPVWVLQSVAGGWLGADTLNGGLKTAALGLVTHFFIATTAAAVYCVASLRLPWLVRRAIIAGALYGVAVYLMMYMVVLPLSAYRFKFFNQPASAIVIGVLIHIFCVGLPIALAARRQAKYSDRLKPEGIIHV
jgi:O-antigen/teichoic acid export membrane protein